MGRPTYSQLDKSTTCWMWPKYNVDNFSNVRTGISGEGEYFWWLVIEVKIDWWFGDFDQKLLVIPRKCGDGDLPKKMWWFGDLGHKILVIWWFACKISTIGLNMAEFSQNWRVYSENKAKIGDGDLGTSIFPLTLTKKCLWHRPMISCIYIS